MTHAAPLPKLDPRRALVRASISLAAGGGLSAALLLMSVSPFVAVLAGWDLAGLVLLGLAWAKVVRCDAQKTQRRAAEEDPGRTAVYVVVLVASAGSLFATTVLSRVAKVVAPERTHELIALSILSVALSWVLTNTAFTLRYAHLYYREDAEGVGGIALPGGEPPTYFDFAYLSFTVGMCFQVSDVTVTSSQIRRSVLLQGVISFVYNTVILAFTLNLVFGMMG